MVSAASILIPQPGHAAETTAVLPAVAAQANRPGVPRVAIDYTYQTSVADWWANHPLNPRAPGGLPIGGLRPFPNVVTLQPGHSIQAAIDAAKDSGVTIRLAPGTYQQSVVTRGYSNIQIVAEQPGTVILRGHLNVTGGERAIPKGSPNPAILDYGDMNQCFYYRHHAHHAACRAVMQSPPGNIYIDGLVFDGGGTMTEQTSTASIRDVVYDRVTFRNTVDQRKYHLGHWNAGAGLWNVWMRGARFEGNREVATYLDGVHGGGIIDSVITGRYSSGGFLFFANDDFTDDADTPPDGIQIDEQRISSYVVVDGNRAATPIHELAVITGRQALVQHNVVDRVARIGKQSSACSNRHGNARDKVQYTNTDYILRNNQANSADALLFIDAAIGASCTSAEAPFYGFTGQYTLTGNRVGRLGQPVQTVGDTRYITGSNVVKDNCVGPQCLGARPSPSPMTTATTTPGAPTATATATTPVTPTVTVAPSMTAAPATTTPTNGQSISFKGVQEGQTLSGTVAIEVQVTGLKPSRIDFALIGPKATVWMEKNRPYFFLGNYPNGKPIGWKTTEYPNGAYTLTINVIDRAGKQTIRTVAFQIANGG
jgi:hypothetical protein